MLPREGQKVKGSKAILKPSLSIPRDQAYFYTPEWQKEELKANQDIKRKKAWVTKTKSLKELLRKLDCKS